MTKVFLDTNIFLGFYYAEVDPRVLFGEIGQLKSHLLLPDIVYEEFVRNRDRILETFARSVHGADIEALPSSFLVAGTAEYEALRQMGEEYSRHIRNLGDRIESMVTDPETDPVYAAFAGLLHDPEVITLSRTESHVMRAHRRKLLGNPPKSERKTTIGDEVIWEMLLEQLERLDEDLILVTQDSTYRNHITYLKEEYRERTGKTLFVEDSISGSLYRTGFEPSEALLRYEEKEAL
jgi:predicted nucleic acid-binding protein